MRAEQSQQQDETPLELESSTLEGIVEALSSGRPIALPQNGGNFLLDGEDAKTAFRFYAGRPDLWAQQKQLSGREVDELLQALESRKPVVRRADVARSALQRPKWRITQLKAHRFAGFHQHCDADGLAPETLVLPLDRDVTCIWGFNGAGKTALQSAIMWCLTGKAPRSQHKPAALHEPIAVELVPVPDGSGDSSAGIPRSLSLPPIVPLPSAENLAKLKDKPACDTWVELTLREHSGSEVTVKRALKVGNKGAFSVESTGLEQLGLSQWAIEAGTLMPATAATMRFDEKTTFADAVAQLTGLRPLQEFGRRSERLARRLSEEGSDKAEQDMHVAFERYLTSRRTLVESWNAQSDALGDAPDLFTPDQETEDKSCKAAIGVAIQHLEHIQHRGQEDLVSILAGSPELETKEQVQALSSALASANERLSSAVIGTLRSIETVKLLREIQESDRTLVRNKLEEINQRAREQVARQKKKEEAARWQLYTMVSQWHRAHHPGKPISDCPVCGSDLEQVPPDALVDKNVAEALSASARAHADTAKTLQDWQRDIARELLETIPASLRPFVDTKIQASLPELYRDAYVSELFADPVFDAHLRAFKQNAVSVWDLAIEEHPLPASPNHDTIELPPKLRTGSLASRFANLQVALAMSLHRQLSEEQLKLIGQRYFGSGSFNRTEIYKQYDQISKAPL